MGQGRTHYILEQIHEFTVSFARVARYGIRPWWRCHTSYNPVKFNSDKNIAKVGTRNIFGYIKGLRFAGRNRVDCRPWQKSALSKCSSTSDLGLVREH